MYKKVNAGHERLTAKWNETYGRMKGARKPNWMEAVGNIARSYFFPWARTLVEKISFFSPVVLYGCSKSEYFYQQKLLFFFSS